MCPANRSTLRCNTMSMMKTHWTGFFFFFFGAARLGFASENQVFIEHLLFMEALIPNRVYKDRFQLLVRSGSKIRNIKW